LTTVIWIDWYSYHLSRLRALLQHEAFRSRVSGIELVGGCGVHRGLQFREPERDGLPISSLFPDSDWDQVGQLRLARAVWRELGRLNPSSVLVPGWYTAPALAAALWAKLHRRCSILMSETTEHDHPRVWWKESSKRILVRFLFDFGIAGGKPHVRYLRQLGFHPNKIARCYDVVDNAFFERATDRARQNSNLRQLSGLPESFFLYVGRLAPEKNLPALLRAFASYRSAGGSWSLVLVGDGGERPELEALSQQLRVDCEVIFSGLQASNQLPHYYAFAGCFVLPSVREPWGLVVNEAMASGLPVLVSSRCGCAEDLVESGGNGYLFDPNNESELSDRMLTMDISSPQTRAAMGSRSRAIVAGYSPACWAAEVAHIAKKGNVESSCEF
jgi:1,2-diacylglycerol 3-alpha-glucosyltransferase